jgi:bifunctional non-homologous end joining protein LigD
MLVSSGPLPRNSEKYAFEVKWDGFRALAQAAPGSVRIISRNGNDMTFRYREPTALESVVSVPVVPEGEIVVLDEKGRPDFAALWFRNRSGSKSFKGQVCFMAFDVIQRGDEVLIDRPYRERRSLLEDLDFDGPYWCTPPSHVGDGDSMFSATKAMGLEGVVAKRVDSRYRPGIQSRSWIKTKHFQKRNFALLGWLPPQEWRGDRGCIVLGLRGEQGIAVAAVVESGYGRDLVEQLPQLTRQELRALRRPGSYWAGQERALVAEVKYLEWSPAGGLRHATIVSVEPSA